MQVYRSNVYKKDIQFVSFRSALQRMAPEWRDYCELASLHSVSKGILGECGLRGGYLYLHNIAPNVVEQMSKVKAMHMSPNSVGQCMVEMMVNPPLEGVSDVTKHQYQREASSLFESLKMRAAMVSRVLSEMRNVSVQEVQGGMYAFPRLLLPERAI